jgi:hypothetical protein
MPGFDPNGEKFKGTDGKEVDVQLEDWQWVIKSKNATRELTSLVALLNKNGSATAFSQFQRLRDQKTMLNFAVSYERAKDGTLLGLHQPHGTRPDGSYGALTFENEKFQGTVDIIKDDNGNEVYKEATITFYMANINNYYHDDADVIELAILPI